MASPQVVQRLQQAVEKLKSVDKARLLRSSLGEESLEQAGFATVVADIIKKADFALQYATPLDDSFVAAVADIFTNLGAQLESQATRQNSDYVSQRAGFTTTFHNTAQGLRQYWTHFISAAVEARGFLEDEGIRTEYKKTVSEMKGEADEALKRVKEESQKTIEEARQLAKDIEERARRTAAHISVKDAQKQFQEAQGQLDDQVKLWAALSVGSLAAFLGVAVYLAKIKLPDQWQWHVVYYTAIRVTILTAVGAAATFCLRILRAQMHMMWVPEILARQFRKFWHGLDPPARPLAG